MKLAATALAALALTTTAVVAAPAHHHAPPPALAPPPIPTIVPPPPAPPAPRSGWQISDHLEGVEGRACTARIVGPQMDLNLMLNNAGKPVVVFGHPDWEGLKGDARAALVVNGAKPIAIDVTLVDNIVMWLVSDPRQLKLLRTAATLDLTLPSGKFNAAVQGLGAALDAVKACQAAQ